MSFYSRNLKDREINDSSIIDILEALHNETSNGDDENANEDDLENSLLYASKVAAFAFE